MKPIYEIVGYQLLNVTYNRFKNGIPEFFRLQLLPSTYDESSQTYIINPILDIKFKECDISRFTYSAAFKINDVEWKNKTENMQLNSLFLASIFPYIRSSIHHFTDDYRGAVNLPVIDLRMANLEKGIVFEPHLSTLSKGLKN
jgi:hypothetical protein